VGSDTPDLDHLGLLGYSTLEAQRFGALVKELKLGIRNEYRDGRAVC